MMSMMSVRAGRSGRMPRPILISSKFIHLVVIVALLRHLDDRSVPLRESRPSV
jgi:hypothetical protein